MQEASDAHSKTADSDTVSTYQVSSVQLVTDKKINHVVPQGSLATFLLFAGIVLSHMVHYINSSFRFVVTKDNLGLVLSFFMLKVVMVLCSKGNIGFLFWEHSSPWSCYN